MIVRSAVNAVSKTRAKPSRRRAVTNGPVDVGARLEAELLGQAHRHGRRVLDDDDLRRVRQRGQHVVDRAVSRPARRSGRPPTHWPQLMQLLTFRPSSNAVPIARLAAAADEVDRADRLDLLAHPHALAAQDALGRVAHDRRARDVHACRRSRRRSSAGGGRRARAARSCSWQSLLRDAVQAVVRVVGEQQLDERPARVDGARRVGLDLHAGGRRERAARHEAALALDLDHAHPAGAARRQALEVAQRGNLDARPSRRREQRLAVLRLDRPAVHLDVVDHRVVSRVAVPLSDRSLTLTLACSSRPARVPSQCTSTASRLHASTHVPQAMHCSGMMWCGLFGAPTIASDGHFLTQSRSPCTASRRSRRRAVRGTPSRGTGGRRRAPRTRRGTSAACSAPGSAPIWPRPHRLVSWMTSARLLEVHHALEPLERLELPARCRRLRRDALEDLQHPPRALAARDALAAALALDEVHEELRHVHHAGVVVHHDQAARAHHRADRLQRLVVDVDVEVLTSGMQPPDGPPICTAL